MAGFAPAAGRSRALPRRCPCGGGDYASCCEPLHRGRQPALTAEQLMRSRYSAYALAEIDYLLRTHPAAEPEPQRRRELERSIGQVRWQRLEILECRGGGLQDREGTVRFAAHYRSAAGPGVLRECSRFGREGQRADGAWLYLEALELSG